MITYAANYPGGHIDGQTLDIELNNGHLILFDTQRLPKEDHSYDSLPTNARTYQMTADVAENEYYNAASGLGLGEYSIGPCQIQRIIKTYQVMTNSAQTHSFDLTTMLPDGVAASQISSFTLSDSTNINGIFSATPTISGSTLLLPVASVGTARRSDTVTFFFTSNNYTSTPSILTVETVDKMPVTFTADMTEGYITVSPMPTAARSLR